MAQDSPPSRFRNREGTSVSKADTFAAAPFEAIIDELAPGLPKRSPADILEYVEHHQGLTPAHEIAIVFRISDEDAAARLEKLSAARFLTAEEFPGIRAWRWAGSEVDRLPLDVVKVAHVPPEVQVE